MNQRQGAYLEGWRWSEQQPTARRVTPCDEVKEAGGNTHRCAAQRGHDFNLHVCACGHRWGDTQTINPDAIQP